MRWALIAFLSFGCCLPIAKGGIGDGKKSSNAVNPRERILSLIDSVLSIKNPPKWIIEDLREIIAFQTDSNVHSENILASNSVGQFAFTRAEDDFLLNCWDSERIDIFPDSLIKADTGVVLNFFEKPFFMPFQGKLSSPYGYREGGFHKGIDIQLNKGNPVVVAFSGIVRIAKRYGNYGNVVVVRHTNGLETVYAHLSKIKVKTGDKVEAGQIVGLGGSTGRSSGPHLHFEIRYLGHPVNPEQLLSLDEFRLKHPEFVLKKSKTGYNAYPVGTVLYSVKKGDNWWAIAKRQGLTVSQLKKLNGVSPKSKSGLKVGQILRVS